MEFDAFDAGIEYGGLRNKSDIRLLICYLLKIVDAPVEKNLINEAMLETGVANYFEVNQAISDLLSNANIDTVIENDEECLTLIERGREIAENLGSDLPKTVREKAVSSVIRLVTMHKSARENDVLIEPLGDNKGYSVTFSIMDGEEALMKLTVYSSELFQAEKLRDKFLEDPVRLYSSVITSLTI